MGPLACGVAGSWGSRGGGREQARAREELEGRVVEAWGRGDSSGWGGSGTDKPVGEGQEGVSSITSVTTYATTNYG